MIQKLKEYKEVIAIIVFFLGGFFWLENQFPKKEDLKSEAESLKSNLSSEIQSLDCLLEKYMTLTQLQIRGQKLEKRIEEVDHKIRSTFEVETVGAEPLLSPAMRHELDKLKDDLAAIKDDFKANNDEMEKINNELLLNVCGR